MKPKDDDGGGYKKWRWCEKQWKKLNKNEQTKVIYLYKIFTYM